jgi:hypothetical protein
MTSQFKRILIRLFCLEHHMAAMAFVELIVGNECKRSILSCVYIKQKRINRAETN